MPVVFPPAVPRPSRLVGLALTALGVVAIAVLTLSPQPVSEQAGLAKACVVCGVMAGSDIIANVLLFAPFGAGLALMGLSWRRALLIGAALSATVELTQYLAIPGRFAAVSDVVTNTIGAGLGAALLASRRAWLRPRPRAAARLVTLAALGWLGALGISGWALSRPEETVAFPTSPVTGAFPADFAWFSGEVLRARLGGFVTEHRGTGLVFLNSPAARDAHAEVEVRGRDRRPDRVPLFMAFDPATPIPWLVLVQRGNDVAMSPGTRGWRLRLRMPTVAIRDVLGSEAAAEPAYVLRGDTRGDSLFLAFDRGDLHRRAVLRLAPTLGWSLLSPYPAVDTPRAVLATVAWLAGLALPIGYWARWTARGPWRAELLTAVGLPAILLAGLGAVPLVTGFGAARPWEWLAAVSGMLFGAGFAEAIRRLA